jgi:CubicO group peptidase (beta-lactamase class C family)
MKRLLLYSVFWVAVLPLWAQHGMQWIYYADSIRQSCNIPILGYAVVSADSVLEMQVESVPEFEMAQFATTVHPFRLGSNTKAVTGMLAALLVQEGKLEWETKFFDLFPEWRGQANPAYTDLNLLDLLSFRNCLPMWTYFFEKPKPQQIQGDKVEQRRQFAQWALRQPPQPDCGPANHSNLGFVAAGLMLERASNQSYEALTDGLAKRIGIDFHLTRPVGTHHSIDIPGFDANMQPTATSNPKLNWLMAAGNLRLSLADYSKFMQLQLSGLEGKSDMLPKETFEFLHFGLPDFAVGWFWGTNAKGQRYSHNIGNPGNFVTRTMVVPAANRAYIVFANCMTTEAYEGTAWLMGKLSE